MIATDIISCETIYAQAVGAQSSWPVYFERQFENKKFLIFGLSSISCRVASACADVYFGEFAVSVPEWRLMAQIGRFGAISAKDIAEKISMVRVAISRAPRHSTPAYQLPAPRRQEYFAN
jgi:hypothetical protein